MIFAFYYRHIGDRALLLDLLQRWDYYVDLLVSLLAIILFWEIAKQVILYADKQHPWEKGLLKRAIFQWLAVFGILTPLQIGLMFLYNYYLVNRPANFNFSAVFYTDVPLLWLLFSVMQLIYAVLYFRNYLQQLENQQIANEFKIYDEYRQLYVAHEALKAQAEIWQSNLLPKTEVEKPEISSQEQHLLVQQGNALVPLALQEVAYIFKINDFTLIRTKEKKDFGIDATLEKLEEILPKNDFFRLNRQLIVHKKSIRQIKPDTYGKLNVELSPVYEDEAGVSRTKAQEFRQWLGLNL
ncbi:MAG: LytTR family transcriptional regulator DNA-binding domain-containing protein [Microscillaceae bacterium]|nr:LytTR family transcriptional regulator DNA-binding domain-containing protein [Microscillaceae bacterium]